MRERHSKSDPAAAIGDGATPELATTARDAPLALSLFDRGAPPACPEPFNLAAYCLAPAQAAPDKVALSVFRDPAGDPHEQWTYGALNAAVERATAGFIAQGVTPGDRILLRVGNSARFPILFFAAAAAGAIATPTSAQLTPREALAAAEDCGARLLCVSDDLALDAPPAAARILDDAAMDALLATPDRASARPTAPDEPGYLVYTSGATGRPKGVLHAHRAVWARRMMWDGWYGLGPEDRMLHAGAFNWTYTLGAGLMDPWACGASTVIYAGPADPTVWPTLAARTGATLFAAVPSLYRRILKYADPDRPLREAFAQLRHGLTAGEKLPETVRRDWRDQTGTELYEALGMSECSTFVSSGPNAPPKPGFAGRPQIGRRVAILPTEPAREADGLRPQPIDTPGVLAVHADDPGLSLGYWRRPAEDAAARRGPWFLTGDLARMDADGYVAHLGRADDLMNAMGYRVAPQEVEEALLEHAGVQDCAVAEVEPKPGVRVVGAFVVRRDAALDEAALAAHAAERLAEYKRPRAYYFVEALPRTPTGKLRRKGLTVPDGA